jgi:hypothetical protein
MLEVRPERAPDVLRVIEMPGSATLHDLHAVIQREFELDDDHLYAFFMTNKAWDKRGALMADDGATARATLRSLELRAGKKFLYLFDFGDELRHEITVRSLGFAESGSELPRVVESVGKPPPQYGFETGGEPLDEDLRPLAEEVMRAVEEWNEALSTAVDEDAPLDAALVDRHAALAHRAIGALRGRPAQLESLAAESDEFFDTETWLTTVPFELARLNRIDLALTLWSELKEIVGEGESLAGRANLLARGGRIAEARAQLEAVLRDYADHPSIVEDAVGVLRLLGEDARAEDMCRSLRTAEVQATMPEVYFGATDHLIELLRKQGRDDEALALDAEAGWGAADEDATGRDDDGAVDEDYELDEAAGLSGGDSPVGEIGSPAAAPQTVRRDGPKVGRNDPCPCGSGKKYKKCHG